EAQAIELRARANKIRLAMAGEGEGEAARARLTGIKAAGADNTVLTVEYLQALAKLGDGRASKLVVPADYGSLLGLVSALSESVKPDDPNDAVRPRGGLPIPDVAERVELPAADADDAEG